MKSRLEIVKEYIAEKINRQSKKEELRKEKEERFRNALGVRFKTPKKEE